MGWQCSLLMCVCCNGDAGNTELMAELICNQYLMNFTTDCMPAAEAVLL